MRRKPPRLKLQTLLQLLLTSLAMRSCSSSSAAAASNTAAEAAAAAAAVVAPPSFCYYGRSAAFPAADEPTTMSWGGNMFKVYHNLYHHNKRWYALTGSSSSSSSSSSSGAGSDGGKSLCSTTPGSSRIAPESCSAHTGSSSSSSSSGIDRGMSVNSQLVELPTTDSSAFQDNMRVCCVPGATLIIDFPFPAFPDNLGHWAEILLPTYSVFSNPDWIKYLKQPPESYDISYKYIDRILLVNVKPEMLYNWPKEFLALAIDPAVRPWPAAAAAAAAASTEPQILPPGTVPWDKPLPTLLGDANLTDWCAHSWMLFENVIIIQDRYPIINMPDRTLHKTPEEVLNPAAAAAVAAAKGIGSDLAWQGFWRTPFNVGFNKPDLATSFRAAAAARHLWGPPYKRQQGSNDGSSSSNGGGGSGSSSAELPAPPRVVTVLQYPEDYPPVVNHHALVDLLRNVTTPYGFKVRTVSLTMGAPFLSHMATMLDTGLLISRHGPLLASAVLLPPGAAVLELLPYKWEWRDVSTLYHNMTQSTGHLHHWAWRPLDARFCQYKEPAHVRYAGWTPSECQGRECLLVHAQAGLEVDLDAVKELLERKIPGLIAGQSIEQLREPWPPAD